MMKSMRAAPYVLALSLVSVGGFAPQALAQSAPPAATTAADQSQQSPAAKFVQDLGNNAIGVITNKSLTQDQRQSQYSTILENAFDLKTIGHFVIGRAYDAAPPEQQQEYMKLFQQLVIKIYGDRLNFYSGESFHVKGARQESDRDMIVNSEIDHPDGGQPTFVDWRVRQTNGKFAVIDVVIAGVSQSVTQRQEYSAVVQKDNGKLDGLLELMRQQVQGGGTATTN